MSTPRQRDAVIVDTRVAGIVPQGSEVDISITLARKIVQGMNDVIGKELEQMLSNRAEVSAPESRNKLKR